MYDDSWTRLKKAVNEIRDAVNLCHGMGHCIPALMLLYCGIDCVAGLERDEPEDESTREDFLKWVEQYLLTRYEEDVSALELYAARCGWVHSYTSKSRLVKRGEAREINYSFGERDYGNDLEDSVRERSQLAFIHFRKLCNAFHEGVDAWLAKVFSDAAHKERVLKNAELLLHEISM